MTFRAVLLGLNAAVIVTSIRWFWTKFPNVIWNFPFFILIVGAAAILGKWYFYTRRGFGIEDSRYNGIGEFLVHIHDPRDPDTRGELSARGERVGARVLPRARVRDARRDAVVGPALHPRAAESHPRCAGR